MAASQIIYINENKNQLFDSKFSIENKTFNAKKQKKILN